MKAFANKYGYSDVHPYEVVCVVSEKTLEVRSMNAERDPGFKLEVVPGGFVGHVTNNQDQRWQITQDPDAPVVRIRLTRKGWADKYGNIFRLADAPRKFYDYNF